MVTRFTAGSGPRQHYPGRAARQITPFDRLPEDGVMLVSVTDNPLAGSAQDARTTLALHRRGELNLCDGCYELAGAFSWFPCESARRALRSLGKVGVDVR